MVQSVETQEELDEILKNAGDKLVIIDFYATWCGPCKMIAPKLDKMADEYKDKTIFIKVDVDESEDIVEKYKVSVMPTIIMLKNRAGVGMEQKEFIEGNKPDQLKEAVDKHI